ncbi:MAG: hypothetical protein KDC93_00620, partial [Cyclobacteriaceae bacterium]|nr:hypothetical protein [Cyclobacteriaceae bacterium]
MKRYLILFVIVSALGISIFAYLFYSETGTLPTIAKQVQFFIISVIMANLSSLIVSTIDKVLDKLISWRKMFFTRFAAGF